ncbi:hypothetical protein GCM10010420_01970 [Streptomyces glaucosporus]|uniref:Secreted protein n=1 Tax=Streptomyces glaucosporus TaxID=284044 RepID=A0ABN3HM41_9ACTN
MYEPQQRASNLRVIALAGTVALAVTLPLAAATAGPDVPDASGGRPASSPSRASAPEPSAPAFLPAPRREAGPPEVTAVCGPQASSPEGVRAQTCVLTRNETTWGRMYYRNTTGESLRGALSLMGPDGESVHMPCTLPATDRPGTCDTPPRKTAEMRPGGDAHTAVAEIGAPDGEGLLLRSGSNSLEENGS